MNRYASVKVDGNNHYVRRHSGSPRGLHPRSKIFILADSKNSSPHKVREEFLEEVILMDNTQNQKTKLEIPPEVRSFLEGILQDANMTTLDDAMREEMINELFARLDSYMTSVIVDKMPPEHLDEFIKMNEEKKPREEIEAFIRGKMPNAQDVLTRAFMDFREMYLSNMSIARNAPSASARAPFDQTQGKPADKGGDN